MTGAHVTLPPRRTHKDEHGKAKGKRQKAKGKNRLAGNAPPDFAADDQSSRNRMAAARRRPLSHQNTPDSQALARSIFAFCLLPFAFCLRAQRAVRASAAIAAPASAPAAAAAAEAIAESHRSARQPP